MAGPNQENGPISRGRGRTGAPEWCPHNANGADHETPRKGTSRSAPPSIGRAVYPAPPVQPRLRSTSVTAPAATSTTAARTTPSTLAPVFAVAAAAVADFLESAEDWPAGVV